MTLHPRLRIAKGKELFHLHHCLLIPIWSLHQLLQRQHPRTCCKKYKTSTLTKKTVPEFDDFAKRKKKDDGLFMQAMTKQSATMMSIATVLKESLEKSCSDKSDSTFTSASVNPILTAIGFALKSVPEEKQLECMLDLLQILKSKYVQQ